MISIRTQPLFFLKGYEKVTGGSELYGSIVNWWSVQDHREKLSTGLSTVARSRFYERKYLALLKCSAAHHKQYNALPGIRTQRRVTKRLRQNSADATEKVVQRLSTTSSQKTRVSGGSEAQASNLNRAYHAIANRKRLALKAGHPCPSDSVLESAFKFQLGSSLKKKSGPARARSNNGSYSFKHLETAYHGKNQLGN